MSRRVRRVRITLADGTTVGGRSGDPVALIRATLRTLEERGAIKGWELEDVVDEARPFGPHFMGRNRNRGG